MKTAKIDLQVDSILKVTKSVIQSSDNYNKYYIQNDDSLYSNQLPLLTSLNRSNSLIYENSKEEDYSTIRNPHIRSERIPKLCPLYNDKGDLIPKVASLSKITFRNQNLSRNNLLSENLAKMPLIIKNRYKIIPGIDNAFDELEKDIFNGEYKNLIYDSHEIFDDRDKYYNIVNEMVENIKIGKKDYLNGKCDYVKEYDFGKGKKKAKLFLNSIKITFEDITDGINEEDNFLKSNHIELNIPFDLLPIFYNKGEENFKSLLTSILKFDENYENVTINYNNLYPFLNNNEELKKEKLRKKSIEDEIPIIQPRENIIPLDKINQKDTMLMTEPPKINMTEEEIKKSEIHKFSFEIFPPIQKSLCYFNFNQFYFVWTTPQKIFKVTINLPLATFSIDDFNTKVQQYIEYELMVFLLQKEFLNWDFYIMKYLSSFKKFRTLIENLSSINPNDNTIFFISNPKEKFYSFDNWELNDIYTDKTSYNSILQFKPLYAIVTILNLEKEREDTYTIYFNFYQMTKFIKIKTYLNKVLFFIKFLNINYDNNTISYNYDILDDFNIGNWVKDIKDLIEGDYFKESEEKNEKLTIEFDGNSPNIKIKIELKEPILTLKYYDNGKENSTKYCVIDDIQDEISNQRKFINWSPILPKAINKDYEIIMGVIPENTINIKRSKKSKKSIVEDSGNKERKISKKNTIDEEIIKEQVNSNSMFKKIVQSKKNDEGLKLKDIPLPIINKIQVIIKSTREEIKNENVEVTKSNKIFDIFKGKKGIKLNEDDISLPLINKMKIVIKNTNDDN